MNNNIINSLYPTVEDIRIACETIVNGIDNITPILTTDEIIQFKEIASGWLLKFNEHKNKCNK